MVEPVSWVVDFVAANPVPTVLLALLLLFVFGAYLFLRRTVKEFRRGVQGE